MFLSSRSLINNANILREYMGQKAISSDTLQAITRTLKSAMRSPTRKATSKAGILTKILMAR